MAVGHGSGFDDLRRKRIVYSLIVFVQHLIAVFIQPGHAGIPFGQLRPDLQLAAGGDLVGIADGQVEADGIRAVREAEAEGLKMLNASKPTEPVVTLRYYESLAKIADGKATKIFLPNNLEKAASLASVVKEVIKD